VMLEPFRKNSKGCCNSQRSWCDKHLLKARRESDWLVFWCGATTQPIEPLEDLFAFDLPL
jgi:hypothetical protein